MYKIQDMQTIDKEQIRRELHEQKHHLLCSPERCPHTDIAEQWLNCLPGLSPRQLCASLTASLGNPARTPEISVLLNLNHTAEINLREYGMELFVTKNAVRIMDSDIYKDHQEQGTGTRLTRWVSQIAKTIGKPRIELNACKVNGGYTWARLGFAPTHQGPISDANIGGDWPSFKQQLKACRLNDAMTHITFTPSQSRDLLRFDKGPYAGTFPAGFDLTKNETDTITAALESSDPQKIWLLSDLGREIGRIDRGPGKPPHIITVGKALLCGSSWTGHLDLTPDTPGHDRFTAYINRAPVQTPTATSRI